MNADIYITAMFLQFSRENAETSNISELQEHLKY